MMIYLPVIHTVVELLLPGLHLDPVDSVDLGVLQLLLFLDRWLSHMGEETISSK